MENKRFALNYRIVDKVLVVEFSGYLTTGLSDALAPAIEKRLAEGGKDFLFDFSGVTMLDSPAVGGILTVTEMIVDDQHGYLAFANLNEMAAKILEMVGVFLYAGRFDNEADAIAEMKD